MASRGVSNSQMNTGLAGLQRRKSPWHPGPNSTRWLGHFIMVHDVMLCLAGSVPCNGSSPPVNCASVIPHAMCAHPHNKSLGGTALSYRARVSIN